eukprot:g12488.t1
MPKRGEQVLECGKMIDPKLLETLRQAPRSADARFKLAQRVRGLRGLREEGTTNSSSEKLGAYAGRRYSQKVSCAAALELMRLLWRGALRLPHELELELANTGATFLASLDSDQDSELSLDEFIEFAAVLVQLSDTRVSEVASELDQMVAKPAFLSALGLILRQLSDSIDMLSADIRYSCRLLAKSFQGPLQSLETCWLKPMSYETADSQKEEFRKYLEKNGIISQLTRVLVGLYEEPERPANAIDYIKKYLGAPTGVDELRADNDELRRQNAELEAKVASLTQQLKELQTEQEEQDG